MRATTFIVDASVLQSMIEDRDDNKSKQLLEMLKKLDENNKFKDENLILTTCSSLLRAIYLADTTKVNFQNLQKIVSCITVAPSFADFRDKDAVIKEVTLYAKKFSGGNNEV